MTYVVQVDDDTVAFVDEGRYVRVPREVLVQEHAKIPHRGALTHYVPAEPNRSRAHASTILTGATDNELCFSHIYFQTMGMEPGAARG